MKKLFKFLSSVTVFAMVLGMSVPLIALPQTAKEADTITDVTLNGGSSVVVEPGEEIEVFVSVSGLAPRSPGAHWKTTSYEFVSEFGSEGFTCVDHSDHTNGNTASETFNINAPNTPGDYDFEVTVYHAANCNNAQDHHTLLLVGVITVEPATGTLTLQKTVVNDNGGTAEDTDWTLSADGPESISGQEGDPEITSAEVTAGTYD